jgi:dienelactone hydrolase
LPQAWGLFGFYPGFHSSAEIGFRCVQNLTKTGSDQGSTWIDIEEAVPQYTPAPESDVRTWIAQHYDYANEAPLNARVVQRSETDNWWREKIEFNGADGQRAHAYLYLPKHFSGPHPVVHLLPAGDVRERIRTVPQSVESDFIGFLRSGRAIFTVVLRGYLERDMPDGWDDLDPSTIEYVESKAGHIIDLRRGLDYLQTRDDIDPSRVAFLGSSVGGPMLIPPAVESRYRAVILHGAGLWKRDLQRHRAVNPVNYVPLIRRPTLFVHGRYDESMPLNTAMESLYQLVMGPKSKQIHNGGHYDATFLVREANVWLDETLGPVKSAHGDR